MYKLIAFFLVILFLPFSVCASEYFYSDLEAKSQNEIFFANVIFYGSKEYPDTTPITTVYNGKENKIMWSRNMNDTPLFWPTKISISDNGYLVAENEYGIIVFDQNGNYKIIENDNRKKGRFNRIMLMANGEYRKYRLCDMTGCSILPFSTSGFITKNKKIYYFNRLYWGRTYLIDLTDGNIENDFDNIDVEEHLKVYVEYMLRTNYIVDSNGLINEKLLPILFLIKTLKMEDKKNLLEIIYKKNNNRYNYVRHIIKRID